MIGSDTGVYGQISQVGFAAAGFRVAQPHTRASRIVLTETSFGPIAGVNSTNTRTVIGARHSSCFVAAVKPHLRLRFSGPLVVADGAVHTTRRRCDSFPVRMPVVRVVPAAGAAKVS